MQVVATLSATLNDGTSWGWTTARASDALFFIIVALVAEMLVATKTATVEHQITLFMCALSLKRLQCAIFSSGVAESGKTIYSLVSSLRRQFRFEHIVT
jgi:hypothetical protein